MKTITPKQVELQDFRAFLTDIFVVRAPVCVRRLHWRPNQGGPSSAARWHSAPRRLVWAAAIQQCWRQASPPASSHYDAPPSS